MLYGKLSKASLQLRELRLFAQENYHNSRVEKRGRCYILVEGTDLYQENIIMKLLWCNSASLQQDMHQHLV